MRWIVLALAVTAFMQKAEGQPREDTPHFRASANLVLLDLVVRDKKGHPVKDLRPADIEIYDNGEKVEFHGLRLVEETGEAAVMGKSPHSVRGWEQARPRSPAPGPAGHPGV
jgi:hypothetical protein